MISINEWWMNKQIDKVNKPNGCVMASYNIYYRSKNIKNTKIKPTIYMVMLIIVATTIMTKATTENSNKNSNNNNNNTIIITIIIIF